MPERTRLGMKRAESPRYWASWRRSPPVTKICGGWSRWAEIRWTDSRIAPTAPQIEAALNGGFGVFSENRWRFVVGLQDGQRQQVRAIEGFGRHAEAGEDDAALEGTVGGDQVDSDGGAGTDDDCGACGIAEEIGGDGGGQAIEADAIGMLNARGDWQVGMCEQMYGVVGRDACQASRRECRVPSRWTLEMCQRQVALGSEAARFSGGSWPVGNERVSRGVGRVWSADELKSQPILVALLPISTAMSVGAVMRFAWRCAASRESIWRTSWLRPWPVTAEMSRTSRPLAAARLSRSCSAPGSSAFETTRISGRLASCSSY